MKIAFNGTSYLVLKPNNTNLNTHNGTMRAFIVGRCHNYATAEWMMNGIKNHTVAPQFEYVRCDKTNRIIDAKSVQVKSEFFRTVRA